MGPDSVDAVCGSADDPVDTPNALAGVRSGAGGCLYVVATPIGNLGDMSQRALAVLGACDVVACEDTRVSGRLLDHFGIRKPLLSYRDENEIRQSDVLCGRMRAGEKVVLMSDAGVPTVSDPGFRMVRQCRREGIPVIPIPGASAVVTALCCSGLPSDAFLFLGFLAPKSSARIKAFQQYREFPHTLIFYESPHRILKFMNDVVAELGPDRVICVCKELTKLHERVWTGAAGEVRASLMKSSTKGEFVVLIAPSDYVL